MQRSLNREIEIENLYNKQGMRRFCERMRILTANPYWEAKNLEKRFYGFSLYDYKTLEKAYFKICKSLNAVFKESKTTYAEIQFCKKLKSKTRLKFFTSFWIINRNVDFFFPSMGTLYPRFTKGSKILKQRHMRGLAIEVDGDVHNLEVKIKKDENRDELLNKLCIGVTTVKNEDLAIKQINQFISGIRTQDILCTRSKRRIMSKIYFLTIVYHATDSEMQTLFNKDFAVDSN